MNNWEIDLIRKKYDSLILEKKRIQKVRNRILELESDPKVKEYLSLMSIVGNMDEEQVEKYAFNSIDKVVCYTKDSNKLLYDYGTVNVITYEQFGEEYESSFEHVYRDLETTCYYFEMIDTIKPMPPVWRLGFTPLDRDFYGLRKYFIEQIMNRPQEEVVEELLETNKQLVKEK